MPSPKSNRNCQAETHRRGRLGERSSSFHGNNGMAATPLRRPKTVPDLLSYRNQAVTVPEGLPRQPPKLLLKVTVLGSLGPVQVVMRVESTVGDLIATAVRQYVKEGRRPILPSIEASDFDLHYSQFSLESLQKEEKLLELGSRNFFLCPRKAATTAEKMPLVSCAKEAGKASVARGGGGGGGFGWFKLMHFKL